MRMRKHRIFICPAAINSEDGETKKHFKQTLGLEEVHVIAEDAVSTF